MSHQPVGRIVSLSNRETLPTCYKCVLLKQAIREYLDGYVARTASQEGAALKKLEDIIDGPI